MDLIFILFHKLFGAYACRFIELYCKNLRFRKLIKYLLLFSYIPINIVVNDFEKNINEFAYIPETNNIINFLKIIM